MSKDRTIDGLSVWFPKSKGSPQGYYDKTFGKHFKSRQDKVAYMKANNMREDGSMESSKHRATRIVQEVNAGREKQGLPPQSASRILGDSPHAKYVRKYY